MREEKYEKEKIERKKQMEERGNQVLCWNGFGRGRQQRDHNSIMKNLIKFQW